MEEESLKEKKRLKETTNPWERVVSNVELNAGQYVGQADVARMRQAMIARKADITKAGGAKKANLIWLDRVMTDWCVLVNVVKVVNV